MAVLAGVAAVIVVAVVIWLIAGGARAIRRRFAVARARRDRGRGNQRSSQERVGGVVEPDWIYGDSRRSQATTAPPPSSSPEVWDDNPGPVAVPLEAVNSGKVFHAAELEAAQILRQAEERAREILAAADAERLRLEREAARDRALAAEERTKLSAFLGNVLKEVQQSGMGATIRDLRELRDRKEKAGSD